MRIRKSAVARTRPVASLANRSGALDRFHKNFLENVDILPALLIKSVAPALIPQPVN